jgi:hypothetical protein
MEVHLVGLTIFEGGSVLPTSWQFDSMKGYQHHALGMTHDTYGVYQTVWFQQQLCLAGSETSYRHCNLVAL